MLMSAIDGLSAPAGYPELAGKRVLITGLSATMGVDLARAFAEVRARLVLQFDETSAEMEALSAILAQSALDLAVFGPSERGTEEAVRFARTAVTRFGGLDVVINIVPLGGGGVARTMTPAEIETEIAERLLLPCLVSRVAANRMRVAMIDGLVLNIATLPGTPSAAERAFAGFAKTTLAAVTRREAKEWADQGIRFNAIAPDCSGAGGPSSRVSENDISALALYLASGKGKSLTGHVLDPELVH